jgi:tRNA modification GTPase
MSTSWTDTIVALATPPGIGAIGVIRMSGNQAISIIDNLFPGKSISSQAGNTLHVGLLKEGEKALDEVVVSVFKSPKSYTGEHVIEISCHGSSYVQQQIIEACIRQGARLAKPGEFTMRAFLNGKMDLVQAEAVADLIASETQSAKEAALHQVKGGFSHVLAQMREELIKFSALIELELDFSQEDVEFADRTSLAHLLQQIEITIHQLLESFKLGNVIKNGVSVAIIGKPNAGKSTLLNALLNENRAIVSSIAGTTRDTIEEVLNIDGILFRLIDTAGIREGADEIEAIGVERSLEKMRIADLVVYLFDVNTSSVEEIKGQRELLVSQGKQFLLVGNKIDSNNQAMLLQHQFGNDITLISAQEKTYIDVLKKLLAEKVISGVVTTEGTVVTNSRHYQSLHKVAENLLSIRKGMEERIPGDLLAIDIRQCLYHLGEITGAISNEDQLDFIFSKFCIGK